MSAFDGDKRSCRAKLSKHNQRRRGKAGGKAATQGHSEQELVTASGSPRARSAASGSQSTGPAATVVQPEPSSTAAQAAQAAQQQCSPVQSSVPSCQTASPPAPAPAAALPAAAGQPRQREDVASQAALAQLLSDQLLLRQASGLAGSADAQVAGGAGVPPPALLAGEPCLAGAPAGPGAAGGTSHASNGDGVVMAWGVLGPSAAAPQPSLGAASSCAAPGGPLMDLEELLPSLFAPLPGAPGAAEPGLPPRLPPPLPAPAPPYFADSAEACGPPPGSAALWGAAEEGEGHSCAQDMIELLEWLNDDEGASWLRGVTGAAEHAAAGVAAHGGAPPAQRAQQLRPWGAAASLASAGSSSLPTELGPHGFCGSPQLPAAIEPALPAAAAPLLPALLPPLGVEASMAGWSQASVLRLGPGGLVPEAARCALAELVARCGAGWSGCLLGRRCQLGGS